MNINNCLKYIEDVTQTQWFITYDNEIGRRFLECDLYKMSIFLKKQGIEFKEYDNCIFIGNEFITKYIRNDKINSLL